MQYQERGSLSTADPASAGDQASGLTAVQDTRSPSEPSLTPQATSVPIASTSLFTTADAESLRKGWGEVQAGFVDDPRRAVEQADSLVVAVIKTLTDGFAGDRSKLEAQWSRGEEVSTEDLRTTLQSYRSFFDRLLSL